MIKSRKFALIFRIAAFVISAIGIVFAVEIFHKGFNPISLLFYTLQSNIIVCIWFGILVFKTAAEIKKSKDIKINVRTEKSGKDIPNDTQAAPNAFYPRTSAAVLFCILITFAVFWCALAPIAPIKEALFSPTSLGVHLITPLLMLADYVMFSAGGKLKKRDPFLFALIPMLYFTEAIAAGLCGILFVSTLSPEAYHFPYFFMDYTIIGWWMALTVPLFIVLLIGFGYLFFYIDRKRIKNTNLHNIKHE